MLDAMQEGKRDSWSQTQNKKLQVLSMIHEPMPSYIYNFIVKELHHTKILHQVFCKQTSSQDGYGYSCYSSLINVDSLFMYVSNYIFLQTPITCPITCHLPQFHYFNVKHNFIKREKKKHTRTTTTPILKDMSRLFTEREKQFNNQLLPQEIEDFLGKTSRSVRSLSL